MKLIEALGSPVPYKWKIQNNRAWKSEFSVGELKYEYKAEKRGADVWTIMFVSVTKLDHGELDYKENITGSGSEFKVFATVVKMTTEFMDTMDPNGIMFSAEETSRARLYDRFAKQLAKKYDMKYNSGKSEYGTSFTLMKLKGRKRNRE